MARWACTSQLIFVVIVCACIHGLDCEGERAGASCSDGDERECTTSDHSSLTGSLEILDKKNHKNMVLL